MIKLVNCMNCLCDDDIVVTQYASYMTVDRNGITHALCETGFGYVFRLCDYDKSGVLRDGLWPSAQIHLD